MKAFFFQPHAVAVAALFVVANGAAWAQVTIELRPFVEVSKPQVTLSDVANLSSRDLSILRQLMALPLGTAPRPGSTVSLRREDILRWVVTRTGNVAQRAAWAGADQVEIKTLSKTLPGAQLQKAARATLEAWLRAHADRFEVEQSSEPRDLDVPVGEISLRPRRLADDMPVTKRVLVWLDVWVNHQFVTAVPVRFDVNAFHSAWVVMRDVREGQVLKGQVEQCEVNMADTPATPWQGSLDDANLRLRRPLTAGEVVGRRHVEAAPAVARGEWVMLRTQVGQISFESRVEVLQDARIGQFVRVKARNAAGPLMARVAGPGQLEMVER